MRKPVQHQGGAGIRLFSDRGITFSWWSDHRRESAAAAAGDGSQDDRGELGMISVVYRCAAGFAPALFNLRTWKPENQRFSAGIEGASAGFQDRSGNLNHLDTPEKLAEQIFHD